MTRALVQITNRLGLHARAAAKVVHTANAFQAEILIGTEEEEVNAKSILGLLTLAATDGTPLVVRAQGVDEEAAVKALVELFDNKFGEGE
jgi:phosphocarrier protein HPr